MYRVCLPYLLSAWYIFCQSLALPKRFVVLLLELLTLFDLISMLLLLVFASFGSPPVMLLVLLLRFLCESILLLFANLFWIIWSICCLVKWNWVSSRQTRCSDASAAISVQAADDASKSRWSFIRKIISDIISGGKSSSFGCTSGPG